MPIDSSKIELVEWPASTLENAEELDRPIIGREVEFGLAGVAARSNLYYEARTLFGTTYMCWHRTSVSGGRHDCRPSTVVTA